MVSLGSVRRGLGEAFAGTAGAGIAAPSEAAQNRARPENLKLVMIVIVACLSPCSTACSTAARNTRLEVLPGRLYL
jgi:hypothetical protein